MEDIEDLMTSIEKFGNARGEVSAKWVRGVTRFIRESEGRVNILATVENLRTLLDRVHRGEFFVCLLSLLAYSTLRKLTPL